MTNEIIENLVEKLSCDFVLADPEEQDQPQDSPERPPPCPALDGPGLDQIEESLERLWFEIDKPRGGHSKLCDA